MKTTNNLVYKTFKHIPKENITLYVSIRLNDECRNGHEDFAITGDTYEYGEPKTDWYHQTGGCIHETIYKHFPEFKSFIDLHLAQFSGIPMYAVANGVYHLKTGFERTKRNHPNFKKEFCEYYRIPEEHFEAIDTEEEEFFKYQLITLGIVKKWQKDADVAIKQLEKLTGKKFKSTATRAEKITLTTSEIKAIKKKIEEGYYTPAARKQRIADQRAAEREEKIAKLKKDADEEIKSIELERDIYIYLLQHGFSTDNFIFYKHSNEGVFNWKNYETQFTQEEFDELMLDPTIHALFPTVTFKLKE